MDEWGHRMPGLLRACKTAWRKKVNGKEKRRASDKEERRTDKQRGRVSWKSNAEGAENAWRQ